MRVIWKIRKNKFGRREHFAVKAAFIAAFYFMASNSCYELTSPLPLSDSRSHVSMGHSPFIPSSQLTKVSLHFPYTGS